MKNKGTALNQAEDEVPTPHHRSGLISHRTAVHSISGVRRHLLQLKHMFQQVSKLSVTTRMG